MAKDKETGGILETIKTVVYALLIAGIFRTLFFQPFWIPSGSMKDTLLIGDFLFVNKMSYGYSYASCPSIRLPQIGIDIDATDLCGWMGEDGRLFGSDPRRGDIAVFRHPVHGTDFIKRVIGLPGDRIQVREGLLYINDDPVQVEPAGIFAETAEPQGPQRLRPRCANGPVGTGGVCEKERFTETLPGGVSHNILNIAMQGSDNTRVYTVPAGHYFMMGDNRDNSSDSRVPNAAGGVGFVPVENFIGKARRVVFSSAGSSMLYFWTWRADRFFHKLQ
ncbi:signal peptidase [Salipiger aestuarii]|uniref:Signal peptidase I n=1 Tax=Salipiger aestuarii TaxID=568098 RepID=A0A327Y4Z3_9RHOB|nr:signal peptidase I [Salipiger aestuarii]EIE50015.1 signal peptidase I [Citreicella sp. 357]KAA8608213.1 signal peptidase [Salipiger aestuarii]KAA8611479.1 signal peptidase [Salipiger aestuarii]KAB2541029.1 signal peptidase [Salipiger aestuarii]RAK15507.1 signal peptidase I [Salipiger aestuarii]